MIEIKSIRCRRILNSHVEFTNEFVLELSDGSTVAAAAPQGETISVYERGSTELPQMVLHRIETAGLFGRPLQQEDWDAYLEAQLPRIGRNNAYSLSLAFHQASERAQRLPGHGSQSLANARPPRLCCNILNGGSHAYTNAVLSDFPEFLLVARSNDVAATLEKEQAIQQLVRRKLLKQPKRIINGNPVSCFATATNAACFEFIHKVCCELGLSQDFELMVDASAGDLWREGNYQLNTAENRTFSPEEFRAYWIAMIEEYQIAFLEDPFHEHDLENWRSLVAAGTPCRILGDNFYASDSARLAAGAAKNLTHGLIVKPNQAGTVSAIRRVLDTASRHQQLAVASHRSISTEETWIATLACFPPIEYFKVGPLATDYSSVLRLNQVLRLCAP
jgi:enolase